MTIRPSRFIGALVTAILLIAGITFWRSSAPAPGRGAITAAAKRGGEIVASTRGEPRTFNRLVARDLPTDILNTLMQASLVRINRTTFELEPWLAEKWESSADGKTHTLHLRPDLVWSDGTPLTAADVVFTVKAVYDPRVESALASVLTAGGQPLRVTASDDRTVVVTFAQSSGPGLRLLDPLPILPRHKLEAALTNGTFKNAWGTQTPPSEIVGAGPFVLREYQPGQRVVLERNPHYWRKASNGDQLPYLDRLIVETVPDQNAELLRLQSGSLDLTQDAIRPEDFVAAKRAESEGRLTLLELGVAPDADAFWFCLKPEAKKKDPRFAFVQKPEFRKAISHAMDREEFAQTVFLGEAVPIWGPVTPGNRQWFNPNVPRYPPNLNEAHRLLASIGLEDRNGNGVVEDAAGTEARFTVITQAGIGSYERGTTLLREQAAKVGIALDIAPMEFGSMIKRLLSSDYDAIYMRPLFTDLDPAGNMDFWLSSGSAHIWNLEQKTPATEWEKRIDILMLEQAATPDQQRRHDLFNDAQRILGENVPALWFVAPRVYAAYNARLIGVSPSVMRPPILWSADTIAVTAPRAGSGTH